MRQQYEIVSAAAARFKSSLFDIRAMAQADLFDNESLMQQPNSTSTDLLAALELSLA
jgi:predicted nuclease of restriction endonuclease-like RecB superfamily